jgi:O-antigen/teichoic acid export membrane protein
MRDPLQAFWKRARQSAMLYGALGTIMRVGANVLLLPFVLKRLSEAEQAMWWVFVAWGAVANLADFGFGQSLSRVYSYLFAGAQDFDTEGLGPPPERREPNLPRLRMLNSTVGYLYSRLCLAGTGLLALGGSLFLLHKVQSAANPAALWICWGLYVAAIGYSLATTRWYVACQGVNRVRELQVSNLWSGLAYLVSASALLLWHWGLFAMVAATGLRSVIAHWMCRRAFHQAVPPVAGPRAAPELQMLRKLWPNARKFGVLSLGVYLIFQANVLICSHYLGDKTTASFGLTVQVGTFLTNFSALWLVVKWPAITILRAQGRLREMGVLFARRLVWVMGTFLIGAVLLVLLGNRLLEWKGVQTRLLPESCLVVYLFYLGQQQFYVQFGSLTFTENVVPFFKLSLFTGLGVFLLTAAMTWWLGLWGLVLGPLLATMAVCTWYVPWRGFQGQPLSVREFVCAAVLGRS